MTWKVPLQFVRVKAVSHYAKVNTTAGLGLLRARRRKIEYSTIILFVVRPKRCINIVYNYAKFWRDNKRLLWYF